MHPPGPSRLHPRSPRHTAPQLHHRTTDLVTHRRLPPRCRSRRTVMMLVVDFLLPAAHDAVAARAS